MGLVGSLLVASPLMGDANFAGGVVLVCAHDPDGALGLLINRPTEMAVADHLPEWRQQVADPPVVFLGGPVQVDVAIGIATADAALSDWTAVVGDTGMIDVASMPAEAAVHRVRVFAGYAGWGAGQLESEIDGGDWLVVPAHPDDAFDPDPAGLRRRVLARQTDATRLYADYPGDPRLN
jgi:putative transcriptional regulator